MRRALLLAVVGLAASAPAGALALPVITPTVIGTSGDNGWYVSNVIVNWTITPHRVHAWTSAALRRR